MARQSQFTQGQLDLLKSGVFRALLVPSLAIDVLSSGKKRWRFRRQISARKIVATLFGGPYPAVTIAAAREWAAELNAQVEAGIDPREMIRQERARAEMTVAKAHGLYMVAVREGRSSRAKRPNKPRMIADKLEIYDRDIAPRLAKENIHDVTERDFIRLVEAKARPLRSARTGWPRNFACFLGGPPPCAGLRSAWKQIRRGD